MYFVVLNQLFIERRIAMRKIALFCLLLIGTTTNILAQEAKEKDKVENGWHKEGAISLMFNQAAFSNNWTGGGSTNYAANLKFNYDFNYRYNKLTVDNRIFADYGLTKNRGEEFKRKTNDRIELNTIIGTKVTDTNWYYSFFFNFKTQFADGYEYKKDDDEVLQRTRKTDIFSPAYLQFGPGMLWKKSDNFKINISPFAARLTFVKKYFTRVEKDPEAIAAFNEDKYFGVEANKTSNFELGASVSGYAKFDLVKNVKVENILALYSDYLEKPQNINLDYTLNIVMKINNFMSANVAFQAIYEENAVSSFQIREVVGIGISYTL